MLPFLKHKLSQAGSGMIVAERKPDEGKEASPDSRKDAIMACASDLINAVHAKDQQGVADAIESAFTILDSMPHEEGPHLNEEE